MSAPTIEVAPLEPARRRISPIFAALAERLEAFLDAERGQLPLWLVAAFGGGIAGWFWLGNAQQWTALILFGLALSALGLAAGQGTRAGRALLFAGIAIALGCGSVWWRADNAASPRILRPVVSEFTARIEHAEPLVARGLVRLLLTPAAGSGLPPRVRVSVLDKDVSPGLVGGAVIRLRARLQSPPPMALPGTHDFARDAWFARIGGVGRALGPPVVVTAATGGGLDSLRDALGRHVRDRLSGSAGGIATALVTGDQAGVGEEDADAMRRSGLTHLLSVSGLHIAAVVGAAMLLSLRLLALSPRLALRFNLVLVSAGFGALAGIGYTVLTGMQVPTVRSCIAALLVLGGIALGREALSLRLVATGALAVLIFRPEALAGASFQLSFAAVTAIIVLHSAGPVQRLLAPREEGIPLRLGRSLTGLFLTGLAVEIALMPFAFYHFHRSGLYGVAANLVAIPLTTFVIMPLEALALLLDTVGLGAPLWAATGWSIELLLSLARWVSEAHGSVALLPSMPRLAFAAMVAGMLWLALWATRVRLLGVIPLAIGAGVAAAAPIPDLLITGDGRHLALVRGDGTPVLLRARAGDYVRTLVAESAAFDGDPLALEEQPFARCTREACIADIVRGGRAWRLLALRATDAIPWTDLTRACAEADIVVAERFLPRGCVPRWLKLDRDLLGRSGGVAITLGAEPVVTTVAERVGAHPWAQPAPTIVLRVRPRPRWPRGATSRGERYARIRH
ncbi:MAG: ComEC/Rec2 family competence protein [Sphingomicrobium sp.]